MGGGGGGLYSQTRSNTIQPIFSAPISVQSYLYSFQGAATSSKPVPDRLATAQTCEQRKPSICQLCNAKFSTGDELDLHYKKYHPDRPPPFKCGLCSARFAGKYSLSNHRTAVHDRKRPCKCELCEKSFRKKYDLNKHLDSVHEKKRPFACDTCQSVFVSKGNLKRHIITLHSPHAPSE